MDAKEDEALRLLAQVKRSHARPLLAFSGGKDAIVTAHLAAQVGIRDAVCEVSWYFERQLACVMASAESLGLHVTYTDTVPLRVLRAHPEMIFSNEPKVRGWTFSIRQQRAVKTHARRHGHDCQIFGRRLGENSVKAAYYANVRDGAQCHPLREWSTDEVWAYFKRHNLRVPWIYGTDFGKHEGNAPFYTMRARDHGGVDACWRLAESLDARYTKERILG